MDSKAGDASFRVLSSELDLESVRIAHTHYSHRYVDEDRNVLLPLERLRELETGGVFQLASRFYSFGFGGTLTKAYIDPSTGTAHELSRELVKDGVDAVLLVPA
jgi:hypothetical protein